MLSKKILIIESDVTLREAIKFYLAEDGFSIIERNHADDIVNFVKDQKPDLITLDIGLLSTDGREVVTILKEASTTRDIPILIISFIAKNTKIKDIFEDYLTKPLDKEALLKSVHKILGTKKEMTRNQKVLVVDDEPDVVDIITTHLEDIGLISLKAYNGQEAVEKAASEKPDLIILDIQMPKLNGFEVMNVLSKDQTTWSIPIIVLSGTNIADSDKEKGKKMGVKKFLTKPFESDKLLQEVETALCEKKKF